MQSHHTTYPSHNILHYCMALYTWHYSNCCNVACSIAYFQNDMHDGSMSAEHLESSCHVAAAHLADMLAMFAPARGSKTREPALLQSYCTAGMWMGCLSVPMKTCCQKYRLLQAGMCSFISNPIMTPHNVKTHAAAWSAGCVLMPHAGV